MENVKFGIILLAFVLLSTTRLYAEDPYPTGWLDQFGTGSYDYGEAVATDSSGNVYVTGTIGPNYALPGQTTSGSNDVFVAKYASDGSQLWARQFGTLSQDFGLSITTDSDENIYVTGQTGGEFYEYASSGNYDAFIAKYDNAGNQLWVKQFGTSGVEYARGIVTDSNANVYVTGQTSGAFPGENNPGCWSSLCFDVFVAKYDTNGNQLLIIQFGPIGDDGGESVAIDSDGVLYVAGYVYGESTRQDVFLVAYNADGTMRWERQFGTNQVDIGYGVAVVNNGNVYVTGKTYGWLNGQRNEGSYDAFLVAYSRDGTYLWTRLIGTTSVDEGYAIATDSGGHIYITGYSHNNYGNNDVFVAKYDNLGELIWVNQFGSESYREDEGKGIATDSSGNLYIAGTTRGRFPGQTCCAYYDVFVTQLAAPATSNIPPIANAGEDFDVQIGALAALNGGASSDPDENYPLTYAWALVSTPEGSSTGLSDAGAVAPTFTPDRPGDYVVELTVTDNQGAASVPDTVMVNTYNTPPFADAGADQVVIVGGTLVQLDGTGSYDENGDSLSYGWAIVQKPADSLAMLDYPAAVNPQFTADVNGEYRIALQVTDAWGAENTDEVVVSFNNVVPVADAGVNQSAVVGETVMLDGSASADANGDSLTFSWNLSSKPEGSAATVSNSSSAMTDFTADVEGTYIASLVVNDGIADSMADNADIEVVTIGTATTESINDTIVLLNDMPTESFRNKNVSNALTNKLNAVLRMIAREQYSQALHKLTTDILPKTDGCALRGVPDEQDWIETCAEQGPVYDYVVETISVLGT